MEGLRVTSDVQKAVRAMQAADPTLTRQLTAAARRVADVAALAVKADTPVRDNTNPKNRSTGARPGRTRGQASRGKRPPRGTLRRSIKGFARQNGRDPVAGVRAGAKRSYYARIVHEGRKRSRFGPARPDPYVERPAKRLVPAAQRLFNDALGDVARTIDRNAR